MNRHKHERINENNTPRVIITWEIFMTLDSTFIHKTVIYFIYIYRDQNLCFNNFKNS